MSSDYFDIAERCIVCGAPATSELVVAMRDDAGLFSEGVYPVCETHRDDVMGAEREKQGASPHG